MTVASSISQSVLALIPAHNEGPRISPVILTARQYLPVWVVDDGSSDDTSAVAENAGAVVLRQTPNQGKGAALRLGFAQALAGGYQAVLTLDADGQHDPAEIPAFLNAYAQTQADLIIGQRNFSSMPPLRRLGNSLGQVLFSWVVGHWVPDNQSGYRLISARLMQSMLASQERGFEFEVEMVTRCLRQRYSLGWVPIRTIYASERSHIRPFQHSLQFARMLWQTWRLR